MTENSPSPPPAEVKTGLFRNADGRNLVVTFALVSSLFLLWGVCNGMIDTMDKHFQTELGLSKAQSAWVQFAHYLGYFLMALPAGMLASRLGYKGGIIAGLLMGAVVNMRPDLFHAVHAAVPFVDVINSMMDATLPLTVGEYLEWGNPNEKPAYDYMKSYSPYDNLLPGAYPAILVTTSFNDSQVMYWEPAK